MDRNLRSITIDDFNTISSWRNNHLARNYIWGKHAISKSDKIQWFERAKESLSEKYFIFEIENNPVGLICFTEIDERSGTAHFGMYSDNYKSELMEEAVFNYAFTHLNLRKLSCEILSNSTNEIKLLRRKGFSIEGVFKKHFLTSEGKTLDVIRLGLLGKEWELRNKNDHNFIIGETKEWQLMIDENIVKSFGEAIADFNPIHFDDVEARKQGFAKRIAHGTILNGFISKTLGTGYLGDGSIYLYQDLSFQKPVYIGSLLVLQLTVETLIGRKATVDTVFLDEGNEVVAQGKAIVLIPKSEA